MPGPRELLLPEWNCLPPLGGREVQVFALRSDGDAALLARARRLLSEAEVARAERIRVVAAREEFEVGRAALRELAGRVIGCAPAAVALQTDALGKPFVPGVHTNVSHSRGLIYVALCRAAPVGVDVEWIDPELEALELAEANFREEETAFVLSAPAAADRARIFCGLWTQKEAVAKAHGQGLRIPLQAIHLPAGPTGVAWIDTDSGSATPAGTGRELFFVAELSAPSSYAAALAVRGDAVPISFMSHTVTSTHRFSS